MPSLCGTGEVLVITVRAQVDSGMLTLSCVFHDVPAMREVFLIGHMAPICYPSDPRLNPLIPQNL